MEKEKIKDNKTGTLFWTSKEPRKSMATYQRNQNKFLVNTLNQIDRKAAIMIRINTTLISGLVLFFNYVSEIKGGTIIGTVLIVCCFVSLILAVMAAKPTITKFMNEHKRKIISKYPNPTHNLFIVGIMSHMSLEDYEKSYDELVQNQELQIGNQIRTHYIFETAVYKGFRMLEISYNAFIIGFVFTVLVFMLANLT
ncbi:MAG: Pycsar system effector family protein, partial [Bacteroidota bacterium]